MKNYSKAVLSLFCTSLNVFSTVLAPGFQEAVYVTGPTVVTGMGWAPDGSNRLFVIQQNGAVRIVKDGALLPTPFASISPIYNVSQAGLLGMCFDPNYVVNRYVYFFVTVSSTEQRIVRLTDNNNIGTNQTNVMSGLPAAGNFHNGGAIGFGFDGKLYWAIGEFLNGSGVDANLTSLKGKAGRANLNGAAPLDNPFYDSAGPNNDYIWARGLRNPFKLAFHPIAGDLWVPIPGDVYEQIFLVRRGDHAGWDNYENNQPAGFITPKIKYRGFGTDTRNIASGSGAVRNSNVVTFTTAIAHGFRQGEKITIAGVNNSSFNGVFYVATVPSATTFTVNQTGANTASGNGTATTQFIGGVVTGANFYDSTAFPAAFQTNLFFCDYDSGRVMRAAINGNNEVLSVDDFASGSGDLVDIATGPDGALYYCAYGGTIYRAAYVNASQVLIVRPTGLNMREGGETVFNVRLATAPSGNVTVNIAHSSGDADISTTNTTLAFTPANFTVPQQVRVAAALDADFQSDQARFEISATGTATQRVFVNAHEVQGIPAFTSITTSNGTTQVRASAGIGSAYVLEGTADFLSWLFLKTNVASTNEVLFSDSNGTNNPFRFYRVRSQN